MMTGSPETRTRYLSLGLFAQRLVDVLIDFADHGKENQLNPCLTEAIESLRSVTARNGTTLAPQRKMFSHFEQVRTLAKALPQHDREHLISVLERLLKRRGSKRDLRREANRAIDLFSRLEDQALRNFDQPAGAAPRGIRRLCTAP